MALPAVVVAPRNVKSSDFSSPGYLRLSAQRWTETSELVEEFQQSSDLQLSFLSEEFLLVGKLLPPYCIVVSHQAPCSGNDGTCYLVMRFVL